LPEASSETVSTEQEASVTINVLANDSDADGDALNEKPPTQATTSGLPRPKLSDCPPPMESPATARCSRSEATE